MGWRWGREGGGSWGGEACGLVWNWMDQFGSRTNPDEVCSGMLIIPLLAGVR